MTAQTSTDLDARILRDVPLAPFTTLGVGGPAREFFDAHAESDIDAAVRYAADTGQTLFILGGGSNLLISDEGFNGLVVKVSIGGVIFDTSFETTTVTAGAGVVWDALVAMTVEKGLAGLECLSGIPGLVGGTPIQNVGAYGQDVSETIMSVRCYDTTTGEIVELSNADCRFAYRSSIFNTTEKGRYIVLSVSFSLANNGKPSIGYKDLKERFSDGEPAVGEVRAVVLEIRGSKSMVITDGDANRQSCGSFFKNPIITSQKYGELIDRFPEMPSFPAGYDRKIPAAWLIENAGFPKGYRLGNAGISTRHSLALINAGDATATEVIALRDAVSVAVREIFGIDLTPEPVHVGFS
jgi:UDP-N-acetylmuramate dehydrogenase